MVTENQSDLARVDKLRVGRGTARAEDAQGTPTQISSSTLVYKSYVRSPLCGGLQITGILRS